MQDKTLPMAYSALVEQQLKKVYNSRTKIENQTIQKSYLLNFYKCTSCIIILLIIIINYINYIIIINL